MASKPTGSPGAPGPDRARTGANGRERGVDTLVGVTGEVPAGLRAACVLLVVEALGLVAGGVALLVDTLVGHPTDRASALLAAALAVAAAVALALGARGLLRLRPSARTPMVVLQILTVPVGYQLAFDSDRPEWGGPIMLCALAVLYLLFTPPVRAVLDRPEPRGR
jgi:hypothetical protein